MGNVAGRLPYEFSCPCGARISVDPMTKERRLLCPQCRNPVDFTVDFDTTRRTILVSAVARKSPPAPSSASPAKPAGRTMRGVVAQCPCGTSFPVNDQDLDAIQTCPGCKVGYHAVVKTEAGSKKRVAILVPQKPIVRRDEIIRATIYRKAPGAAPASPAANVETAAPTDFIVVRKSRTRIVHPKTPEPPKPKPVPQVPPGAQAVPCPCGATFIVRRKDIGHDLTCDQCGQSATFVETRDPQTLVPTIRIKPASRG